MVRVASQASSRLAGDQQFGKLRVAFVKFHVLRGDFFPKLDRLFIALESIFGKGKQHLQIARLRDQTTLPARVKEVVVGFRLLLLFNLIGVPGRDKILQVRRYPKGSL